MLVLADLDDATVERAGALVAREQAAARRICPELPAAYVDAATCAGALQRLRAAGPRGIVACEGGRAVAVMTAEVRENPVTGAYARLPAEGFAVDPDLEDPTGVVALVYRELAPPLVAGGARRHYLLHTPLPRLHEATSNLGFGRDGCYGVQSAAARRPSSNITVRVAAEQHLDTIARLARVEIEHRSAAPMFEPPATPSLADLIEEHRALRRAGAVHLLAALDGHHVGLLTIELTSPVPRLCPDGQPYIGPTATVPDARRRGVGQALVEAALDWAHTHGYHWVSVDFATANPLSRPFWLHAGFRPTGYGLLRHIDQTARASRPS
jgi:GNAT superfamily N-acetyltransferase